MDARATGTGGGAGATPRPEASRKATHALDYGKDVQIAFRDEERAADVSRAVIAPMLEPIMQWLLIEEIEEIAINRPQEIWLRLRTPEPGGVKWVSRADKALTRHQLELIIYTLANVQNTVNFGPTGTPTTYGTLPGGHRYAAGIGPNFQYTAGDMSPDGTILFVARQFRPDLEIRLENYGIKPGLQLNSIKSMLHRKADAADPIQRMMASITRGDHILVSGATSTGKTTLLNHIIRMFARHLRIVTVEDASEIQVSQPNHMHILLNRNGQSNNFTYTSVVDLIVRITPDVVMAGEISTTNAAAIWELMRSGHGHFLTTIHAEDVEEAVSSFITRIGHSSPNEAADRERLTQQMHEKLRIIQIENDPVRGRIITEIR